MDKNDQLKNRPFSFQFTKEEKLLIFRDNSLIKTIKGKQSQDFIRFSKSANHEEIQLRLAKLTGNYKRGNEKKDQE